ncbi:flagellar biosynthesis anti-sigma factor FlgM [Thermovibrio sp.]
MKINGISSEALRFLLSEKEPKRRERAKTDAEEVISVEISSKVETTRAKEVDRSKVEEIKEALRKGKYQVNLHKISEALIKEILGDDL